MSVTSVVAPETISLRQVGIRVNGRALSAPASWMIGVAVRIDIPGHGTYVVAAYDPREASPDHGFAAIAHADGKALSWASKVFLPSDRARLADCTDADTHTLS